LVIGARSEKLKALVGSQKDRTKGNKYVSVFNEDDPEPINHVADTSFKLDDDE
jgi:hypothetical protein